MADTISETDVKNAALAVIGSLATTGTDDTKRRQFADSLYPFARNECFDLRVDWRVFTARALLAPYVDSPLHGSYACQFILPSKARRIHRVQESTDDDTEYEFRREVLVVTSGSREIEHDVILANVSSAYVVYTRLRTDPNKWPAYFTHLVYMRLAVLLCEPMKQDKTKQRQILGMYQNAYTEARAGNGSEDKDTTDRNTNWEKGNQDVINAAIGGSLPRRLLFKKDTGE